MKKNGWFMGVRKDPRTGQKRPCSILYKAGKEMRRKWIKPDELKKQGEMVVTKVTQTPPGADGKVITEAVENRKITPDDVEDLSVTSAATNVVHETQTHSAPVRCLGTTADGTRCMNMTMDLSNFCHEHQDQIGKSKEERNAQYRQKAMQPSIDFAEKQLKLAEDHVAELNAQDPGSGQFSYEAERRIPELKQRIKALKDKAQNGRTETPNQLDSIIKRKGNKVLGKHNLFYEVYKDGQMQLRTMDLKEAEFSFES
jgi:hypothetical protein